MVFNLVTLMVILILIIGNVNGNIKWYNGTFTFNWTMLGAWGFGASNNLIYLVGGYEIDNDVVHPANTVYTFNPYNYQVNLTNTLKFGIYGAPNKGAYINNSNSLYNGDIIFFSPMASNNMPNSEKQAYIYNIYKNTITNNSFKNLPYNIEGGESIVTNNKDTIYIINDSSWGPTKNIYSYNLTSNVWNNSLSKMNIQRFYAESMYYKKTNTIYVFGGQNSNLDVINSIEKYVINENKWYLLNTTLLKCHNSTISYAIPVLFNDNIYIIGGLTSNSKCSVTNYVQYFDIKTEKIISNKTTYLNKPANAMAALNWKNEKLFVFSSNWWQYAMLQT